MKHRAKAALAMAAAAASVLTLTLAPTAGAAESRAPLSQITDTVSAKSANENATLAVSGLRNYNSRHHSINSNGHRVVVATIDPNQYCPGSVAGGRIEFQFIGTWNDRSNSWVEGVRITNRSGGDFNMDFLGERDAGGYFNIAGRLRLRHGQAIYYPVRRGIIGHHSVFVFRSRFYTNSCPDNGGQSQWRVQY